MAALWRPKGSQFFDSNGHPLNGGLLRYFDGGTLNVRTVYMDSTGSTPWSQPVTLDSAGRLTASIYVGAGTFKERLSTAGNVDIYTEDSIPGEVVLTTSTFSRPNMPVISKSISYTVLVDDIGAMIQADATGGDVTITLISAVAAGNGAMIGVQNVGTSGKVIVAVPGGETVNGVSTVTMIRLRSGGIFTSNAGAWSGPITDQPFATFSKSTTYTVAVENYGRTIKADASGGAFTVTLPAASAAGDGFEITIIKTDSTTGVVTIDGDGTETINGATTVGLAFQWQSAKVRCDGSNWQTVSQALPANSGICPAGMVAPFGGTTAPAGWLLCYGQAISRATYAALFTAISTTYGVGDGSTTFNLPDLRGRVIAGQDDMGGSSANRLTNPGSTTGGVDGDVLGGSGGEEAHVQTTAEMVAHTHLRNNLGLTERLLTTEAGGDFEGGPSIVHMNAATVTLTASTGSGTAFNVVQPTIILNYIIKT